MARDQIQLSLSSQSPPKMRSTSFLSLLLVTIISDTFGQTVKPETLTKVLRRKQQLILETDPGTGNAVGSEVVVEVTNLETSKKFTKKWVGHVGIYEIPDLSPDTWYGLQFKSITKLPDEFAYSQYKLARTLPELEDPNHSNPDDEEYPLKVSLVVYSDGIRAVAVSPYTKYFDLVSVVSTFCRGGANRTQRISLSADHPESSVLVVNGSNFASAEVVSHTNSTNVWLEVLPSALECSKVCWNTWVVSRNYHESFQQPTQCQLLKADKNRVVFLPTVDRIEVDSDEITLFLSEISSEDREELKIEVQLTDLQNSEVLPLQTLKLSDGLNFTLSNLKPRRHYALQYQPKLLSPAYNGSIIYRIFKTADTNLSSNSNDSSTDGSMGPTVNISQTRDSEKILVHVSSLLEGFDINFTAYLSCADNTSVSAVITPFNPTISLMFNISSLGNDSDEITTDLNNATTTASYRFGNETGNDTTTDEPGQITTEMPLKETGCRKVCWKAAVILKKLQENSNRPVGSDCFQIDMHTRLSLDQSAAASMHVGIGQLIGLLLILHQLYSD